MEQDTKLNVSAVPFAVVSTDRMYSCPSQNSPFATVQSARGGDHLPKSSDVVRTYTAMGADYHSGPPLAMTSAPPGPTVVVPSSQQHGGRTSPLFYTPVPPHSEHSPPPTHTALSPPPHTTHTALSPPPHTTHTALSPPTHTTHTALSPPTHTSTSVSTIAPQSVTTSTVATTPTNVWGSRTKSWSSILGTQQSTTNNPVASSQSSKVNAVLPCSEQSGAVTDSRFRHTQLKELSGERIALYQSLSCEHSVNNVQCVNI